MAERKHAIFVEKRKKAETSTTDKWCFLGAGNFLTTYAIAPFFSRLFNENFKFLTNCRYNFYKILCSHSAPKSL